MTRLDVLRDSLQELLSEYIPISIVIRNKKLHISEETLQNIRNAELASESSAEESLPLPKSTFELCHYGIAIRDGIFANIEDYQIEHSQKRLARRKGSWKLKLISWNGKKINYDLKKYPEPEWLGKKPENDAKLLRKFLKALPSELSKENMAEVKSSIHLLSKIFVNPSSPAVQKVITLEQTIEDCIETEKAYREKNHRLENTRARFQELTNTVEHLAAKQRELKAIIAQTSEFQDLVVTQKQLQSLQEDRQTRSFLKTWQDLLHRYIRWMQREVGSSLLLKDLLAIYDNLLDCSTPLEDLYDEISSEFIEKAEFLYPQRKQFIKRVGSTQQLQKRLGDGKELLFQLRRFQRKVEDLQSNLERIDAFQDEKEVTRELSIMEEEQKTVNEEILTLEDSTSEITTLNQNAYKTFELLIIK